MPSQPDTSASAPFSPGAFADPALCRGLLDRLEAELDAPLTFMEVCGTHTVSIFRSGLRSLLPEGITHLSGPGCPVCVTHEREVAAFLQLAAKDGVIIATFGDLMRVPGPEGMNLKKAAAQGARVEVLYSPLDALALAQKNARDQVVFLAVGFETTAPAMAATIEMAKAQGIGNFSILSFHKLVPPALRLLLETGGGKGGIDAFLLPGHVSTILGVAPYAFIAEEHKKPGIIGGFDPVDILDCLLTMVDIRKKNTPAIVNAYRRAVDDQGNPKAREIMARVFTPAPALWRGLGELPDSGLALQDSYESFNAFARFGLTLPDVPPLKGCRCGDVLRGNMTPDKCGLFGKLCTPATPVGPCMVSTEGSCSAYYKYRTDL